MAIFPNTSAEPFCYWLLNVSGYRWSGARLALINSIYNAALTATSVTDQNWQDFNYFTSPFYSRFLQWRDLAYQWSSYTNAILNCFTVAPSFQYQLAMDTFITSNVSNGNWATLDALWIFATESEQAAWVNWASPSAALLVPINAPLWSFRQGYTGDGSTSYIKTSFVPTINAVNFQLNNNSAGAYVRTNSQNSTAIELGTYSGIGNDIYYNRLRNTSNQWRNAIFSSLEGSNSNSDSRGLFQAVRLTSTTGNFYRNGMSIGTGIASSGSLSSKEFYILAQNSNGTAANFSPRQVSMVFLASSSLNAATFYSTFQTFATSIGFNV